jgi:hypothetical protein
VIITTYRVRWLATTAAVVLALVACSSSHPSPSTSSTSLPDLCAQLGGKFVEETDGHEIYTNDQGDCGALTLYSFPGARQRDAWLNAAITFGGNYLVGPRGLRPLTTRPPCRTPRP